MARTWSAGNRIILHNHVDESWYNTAISYDISARKIDKLVLKNSLGIDLADSELAQIDMTVYLFKWGNTVNLVALDQLQGD